MHPSMTPMHPSMTPMHPSATPMHPGGQTPAHPSQDPEPDYYNMRAGSSSRDRQPPPAAATPGAGGYSAPTPGGGGGLGSYTAAPTPGMAETPGGAYAGKTLYHLSGGYGVWGMVVQACVLGRLEFSIVRAAGGGEEDCWFGAAWWGWWLGGRLGQGHWKEGGVWSPRVEASFTKDAPALLSSFV